MILETLESFFAISLATLVKNLLRSLAILSGSEIMEPSASFMNEIVCLVDAYNILDTIPRHVHIALMLFTILIVVFLLAFSELNYNMITKSLEGLHVISKFGFIYFIYGISYLIRLGRVALSTEVVFQGALQ